MFNLKFVNKDEEISTEGDPHRIHLLCDFCSKLLNILDIKVKDMEL